MVSFHWKGDFVLYFHCCPRESLSHFGSVSGMQVIWNSLRVTPAGNWVLVFGRGFCQVSPADLLARHPHCDENAVLVSESEHCWIGVEELSCRVSHSCRGGVPPRLLSPVNSCYFLLRLAEIDTGTSGRLSLEVVTHLGWHGCWGFMEGNRPTASQCLVKLVSTPLLLNGID